MGNRLQTVDGGTTGYTPNPLNQYESVGGAPFTYDLNGNLTSDGVNTYTYDAENRLLSVVRGPSTVDFSYDAFGRRISQTVDGEVTHFVYDGDQVIEERDRPNTQLAEYVYGPGIDELLRIEQAGQMRWVLADGLGSTIALMSPQGAVVESYRYDVYGKPAFFDAQGNPLSESAYGMRYLFTGREYDQESGLYHYRARAYHPGVGRFLQRDPLTWGPDDPRLRSQFIDQNLLSQIALMTQGTIHPEIIPALVTPRSTVSKLLVRRGNLQPALRHPYSYVFNNPVNWFDPLGLVSSKLLLDQLNNWLVDNFGIPEAYADELVKSGQIKTYTWPYSWKGWAGFILVNAGAATFLVPLPGARPLGLTIAGVGVGFTIWDLLEGASQAFDTGQETANGIEDYYRLFEEEWKEVNGN